MAATMFEYEVRDRTGGRQSGQIEGSSKAAVAKALRERGMIPVKVEEKKQDGLQKEIKIPGLTDKVKLKEVAIFSRQFATMVNSGLTLVRALSVLEQQVENPELRRVIADVKGRVEQGSSLSAALEHHPKVFSELYIAMIKAGEVGGALDETLERLADTLEGQVGLRSKVKSAMAYPIVVLGLITVIVIAMLAFVVPMFEGMYNDLGGELPLPTRVLIGISGILKSFWYVAFILTIGGIIGFRRWIKTDSGRRTFDAFKLKVPIFGKLTHKVGISRFTRTLSMLSRTGVPILQALEIVSVTAGNRLMSDAIDDVRVAVKQGESLTNPLERHDIFPPMVTQMMAVGEETGALDTMLSKVADFYDREVEDTVGALTSLIEPLLIIVMGVTVGGILIALYLPMFNLANLIQSG